MGDKVERISITTSVSRTKVPYTGNVEEAFDAFAMFLKDADLDTLNTMRLGVTFQRPQIEDIKLCDMRPLDPIFLKELNATTVGEVKESHEVKVLTESVRAAKKMFPSMSPKDKKKLQAAIDEEEAIIKQALANAEAALARFNGAN